MMQENSDENLTDLIIPSSCSSSHIDNRSQGEASLFSPAASKSSAQQGEASFDSGYSASPARLSFISLSSWSLSNSPFRMDPKLTVTRQPFSPQKIVKTDATVGGYLVVSPVKNSNGSSFSPFKNSTLSPFKLINQSPSKGSFDDWDKDFIAGFEENLFGMHDLGDLSDSIVGELLKSPQGKAFLEKRNSPIRLSTGNAARKLQTLPQHNIVTNSVIVDVNKAGVASKTAVVKIKEEPAELYTVIKEEPQEELELYGEHNYHAVHGSILPAMDPKMNATPSKPGTTYDEKTTAKRKLTLKENSNGSAPWTEINQISSVQQKENFVPAETSFHLWPSKDRLKFARAHFKHILDKAVKEKLEKIMAIQEAVKKNQPKPELKVRFADKVKPIRNKSGKYSRKTSKKDKYPQIKRALSKPAKGTQSSDTYLSNSIIPQKHKDLSFDPGWYPDDDDSDEGDSDSWHGPMPFQRQFSQGFCDDVDVGDEDVYIDVDISSGDEYYPRAGGKKRKKSKKGLGQKKRKY